MGSVRRTKTRLGVAERAAGALCVGGADWILQQHGAEIEASGTGAFFTQQDCSSAVCAATLMGQTVVWG